jgi:hypothetical protein
MRALERDPDKRYPTAEALHRDAARFARVARLSTSPFDLSDFMLRLFPRKASTPRDGAVAREPRSGHGDDEPTGQIAIEPRRKVTKGARKKSEQRLSSPRRRIEDPREIGDDLEVETSLEPTDPVIAKRSIARRA